LTSTKCERCQKLENELALLRTHYDKLAQLVYAIEEDLGYARDLVDRHAKRWNIIRYRAKRDGQLD
jgi:hypothetical protein